MANLTAAQQEALHEILKHVRAMEQNLKNWREENEAKLRCTEDLSVKSTADQEQIQSVSLISSAPSSESSGIPQKHRPCSPIIPMTSPISTVTDPKPFHIGTIAKPAMLPTTSTVTPPPPPINKIHAQKEVTKSTLSWNNRVWEPGGALTELHKWKELEKCSDFSRLMSLVQPRSNMCWQESKSLLLFIYCHKLLVAGQKRYLRLFNGGEMNGQENTEAGKKKEKDCFSRDVMLRVFVDIRMSCCLPGERMHDTGFQIHGCSGLSLEACIELDLNGLENKKEMLPLVNQGPEVQVVSLLKVLRDFKAYDSCDEFDWSLKSECNEGNISVKAILLSFVLESIQATWKLLLLHKATTNLGHILLQQMTIQWVRRWEVRALCHDYERGIKWLKLHVRSCANGTHHISFPLEKLKLDIKQNANWLFVMCVLNLLRNDWIRVSCKRKLYKNLWFKYKDSSKNRAWDAQRMPHIVDLLVDKEFKWTHWPVMGFRLPLCSWTAQKVLINHEERCLLQYDAQMFSLVRNANPYLGLQNEAANVDMQRYNFIEKAVESMIIILATTDEYKDIERSCTLWGLDLMEDAHNFSYLVSGYEEDDFLKLSVASSYSTSLRLFYGSLPRPPDFRTRKKSLARLSMHENAYKLLFPKNHELLHPRAGCWAQHNYLKQFSTDLQSSSGLDYFTCLIFIWNQTLGCGCGTDHISFRISSVGDVHEFATCFKLQNGDETKGKRLLVLNEIPLLDNADEADRRPATYFAFIYVQPHLVHFVWSPDDNVREHGLIPIKKMFTCYYKGFSKALIQWKEHPPPKQATWEVFLGTH